MQQSTPASRILIAALLSVLFTVIAWLTIDSLSQTAISAIALSTFLGGVLTPYISIALTSRASGLSTPRPRKKATPATKVNTTRTSGGDTKTLYVGNLPFKTNEESVKALFERYGHVDSVRLVKDRRSGRMKGYGFVEMEPTGADLALAKLNDSEFEGRTLKVRSAHSESDSE